MRFHLLGFTVTEVCGRDSLPPHVLFVMVLATRAVHIAGITTNPNERWMMQVARDLTDAVNGFLQGKEVLLLDRDTKYSETYRRSLIEDDGIEIIRLPPRSPNLNAYAKRFVCSIKRRNASIA